MRAPGGGVSRPSVAAHSVERRRADPAGGAIRRARDHAPFARGQVLGRIETEAREMRRRSDATGVRDGFDRMRRVFDEDEPVSFGQLLERTHIGRMSGIMHGKNGTRARRDRALDRGRIQVVHAPIDVREHRPRTGVDDGVGGAQNVSGVVMTSSPAPMPAASSDRCSAAVHELTAIAFWAPTQAPNSRSNFCTRGPVVSQPDASVASTSFASPAPMAGRANGIGDRPTTDCRTRDPGFMFVRLPSASGPISGTRPKR